MDVNTPVGKRVINRFGIYYGSEIHGIRENWKQRDWDQHVDHLKFQFNFYYIDDIPPSKFEEVIKQETTTRYFRRNPCYHYVRIETVNSLYTSLLKFNKENPEIPYYKHIYTKPSDLDFRYDMSMYRFELRNFRIPYVKNQKNKTIFDVQESVKNHGAYFYPRVMLFPNSNAFITFLEYILLLGHTEPNKEYPKLLFSLFNNNGIPYWKSVLTFGDINHMENQYFVD